MAGKQPLPKFIGRYEIIDRLGHGGMGVVYRGRDPKIGDRGVAIKVLHVMDDTIRDRFLQEAAIAGNLDHRNIVTIFDYGEHDGQPYIVMQYVEGVTLADQIRSNLQLSLARKLELMEEVAAGLEYAHNKGIVHRDIKPANIMIDRNNVLKILDFGIARASDSRMTVDGTMLGTPNYMSPEQVEGKLVDRRSDVFAVGLVCYELLSYRQAFTGDTIHAVLNAITRETPTPLYRLVNDLDPALELIVNRAIQKDPAKRYQSVSAFGADIAKHREGIKKGRATTPFQTTIVGPEQTQIQQTPKTPIRTPRPIPDRQNLSKRRTEAIENHLSVAQKAYETGDYAKAVESSEQAAFLDPDDPRALELLDRAREAFDSKRIRDWLADAEACLGRKAYDEALSLIRNVFDVDAESEPAIALQKSVEAQRQQDRQREQAILTAVTRARERLASGDLESAVRAASEVLVHDPTNQDGHALSREAMAAIDERRRRQAIDQAATAAIDAARKDFAAGRHREAIAALDRYTPADGRVTAVAAELRRDLVAIEEATRRQAQITSRLEAAGAEIVRGNLKSASDIVAAVLASSPDNPEALARKREIEAAEKADRQAKETDRAAARSVDDANRLFAAGDHQAAIDLLGAFAPAHPLVTKAIGDLTTRLAQIERAASDLARRATDAVAEARRRFDAGPATAIGALKFTPQHPIVTAALTDLRAALRRKEEADAERRREEERVALQRKEAADAERKRDDERRQREEDKRRRVEVLGKARGTASAADAIRILQDWLKRYPGDQECLDLLALREAGMISAIERLLDDGKVEEALQEMDRMEALGVTPVALPFLREHATVALRTLAVKPAPPKPAPAPVPIPAPAPKPPAPVPVASQPSRTNWTVIGGGVAAVLVIGASAVWFASRGGEIEETPPQPPPVTTVAATTSAPVVTVATTSVVVPKTPDFRDTVAAAQKLVSAGDLAGAVGTVIGGLAATPDAQPLADLLRSIVGQAFDRASAARKLADAASASNQPAYVEATTRFQSAEAVRKSGVTSRAGMAVQEYLTAARLYTDAASAKPLVVASVTTTALVVAPALTTAPPTVSSSVLTSAATTSAATTSVVPTIERAAADSLLAEYAKAAGSLDVAKIQALYPALSSQTRDRVLALGKQFSFCEYALTGVQIMSSTATDVVLRLNSVERCKPRTAQPIRTLLTGPQEFRLRKDASGVLKVAEILGLQ